MPQSTFLPAGIGLFQSPKSQLGITSALSVHACADLPLCICSNWHFAGCPPSQPAQLRNAPDVAVHAFLCYLPTSPLNSIFVILAGIGTFQSRTPNIPYTLIPGDVASSIILASMAATVAGQVSQDSPNITQACTSCSNPITLAEVVNETCQYFRCGQCCRGYKSLISCS